jgi:hypothetical protein
MIYRCMTCLIFGGGDAFTEILIQQITAILGEDILSREHWDGDSEVHSIYLTIISLTFQRTLEFVIWLKFQLILDSYSTTCIDINNIWAVAIILRELFIIYELMMVLEVLAMVDSLLVPFLWKLIS